MSWRTIDLIAAGLLAAFLLLTILTEVLLEDSRPQRTFASLVIVVSVSSVVLAGVRRTPRGEMAVRCLGAMALISGALSVGWGVD